MSDVARQKTANPDTVNKHHERKILLYEASTDSPRREAEVASTIKSLTLFYLRAKP